MILTENAGQHVSTVWPDPLYTAASIPPNVNIRQCVEKLSSVLVVSVVRWKWLWFEQFGMKGLVYVFSTGTIETSAVKDAIETLLGRQNCVTKVKKVGRRNIARVEFKLSTDRGALYMKRKKLRMDGKPVVVLLNRHIMGESSAAIDNELLRVARRAANENVTISTLFNMARMEPSQDENGEEPAHRTVSSGNFDRMIRFHRQLRCLVFDELLVDDLDDDVKSENCVSYDEEDTQLDCGKPTLLQQTPGGPLQSYSTRMGGDCQVEADVGDILDEKTEAIVIFTKPDLTVWNKDLENRLLQKTGTRYADFRHTYLACNGPLKPAGYYVHETYPAYGMVAKLIIHLCTDFDVFQRASHAALMEQLVLDYESALMAASMMKIQSVSIHIQLDEFSATPSARAAVSAMEGMIKHKESFRLPKLVRFVHANATIATQFGESFLKMEGIGSSEGLSPPDVTAIRKIGKGGPLAMEDDDDRKLSEATGTTTVKHDPDVVKIAAHILEQESHPVETRHRQMPRRIPYGKRRPDEKKRRKAMSFKEKALFVAERSGQFLCDFAHWPKQTMCWGCEKQLSPNAKEETDDQHVSKVTCQSCYRPYHTKCWDIAGGVCVCCIADVGTNRPEHFDDLQPSDRRMTVKIVDDPAATPEGFPDAQGHIEITYVFQCGRFATKEDTEPQFYFGTTRVAYLPNNEEGEKLCQMLQKAFQRGLLFTIGRIPNGYNDWGVVWGCVPHKTSLIGGPDKWGYPDPKYLAHTENLLKRFGIDASERKGGSAL